MNNRGFVTKTIVTIDAFELERRIRKELGTDFPILSEYEILADMEWSNDTNYTIGFDILERPAAEAKLTERIDTWGNRLLDEILTVFASRGLVPDAAYEEKSVLVEVCW